MEQPPLIHIQLLGDFQIKVGDRIIVASSWRRKAASIVKLLALNGGRLHRDQVCDLLWPELDGAAALNNLHRTLFPARRVLEPDLAPGHRPRFLRFAGEILELSPDEAATIDVHQFRQAAATARQDPSIARYEQAIAQYHGELLPEDRFSDWAIGPRDDLKQLWRRLQIDYAEFLDRLGRGEEAGSRLEHVIADDPTNEPAARLLIRLVLQTGQRSRAQDIFQRLRAAMARELGAEPDEATRALLAPDTIDPGVQPDPAPRTPNNLPVQRSSFVGREREVIDLARLVVANRLVTLTGPGGAGKTRLAIEIGRSLLGRFRDGVWLVELGSLSSPELIGPTVAEILGIAESTTRPMIETVVEFIARRQILIVLDNCEHLRESSAALAMALLSGGPSVTILATSRLPLDIADEVRRPVGALGLPGALASAREITQSASVRLLLDRARERQSDLVLTAASAPSAGRIVRALDGLPLAIELAAARAGLLGLNQIEQLLSDRFRLLRRGDRTVPARQQTLEAAIDWSYQLLSPGEQTLLRQIAIFPSAFGLEAASAVAALDALDLIEPLDSLVQHSLVQVVGAGTTVRYQLLESVRAFGRERLADVHATVVERFVGWVEAFVAREEDLIEGPDQAACLDRISRESPAIRFALGWLADQGAGERYLRLAGALWRFWRNRGAIAEGRRWLTEGLNRTWQIAERTRAKALLGSGLLLKDTGALTEARRDLVEAVEIAHRVGDPRLEAAALNNLAMVDLDRRDLVAAEQGFQASYQIFRDLGDELGAALRLGNLALVANEGGDLRRARTLYLESLELLRSLGHSLGVANAINNLGFLAMTEGAYRTAAGYYREAISLYRALDNPSQVAFGLVNLGWAQLACEEPEDARRTIRDGLRLAGELGNRRVIALSFVLLGVSMAGTEPERAARLIAGGDRDLRAQIVVVPAFYEVLVQIGRDRVAAVIDQETAAQSEEIGRSLTDEQLVGLANYPDAYEVSEK